MESESMAAYRCSVVSPVTLWPISSNSGPMYIPESWPPPLYDRDAIGWMPERLAADQGSGAWGFRYFVHRAEAPAQGRAVGAGDFKGPPSPDGSVEVGYSVLPEFQRRRFATEALKGLMARAYDDPRGRSHPGGDAAGADSLDRSPSQGRVHARRAWVGAGCDPIRAPKGDRRVKLDLALAGGLA
ncbi:MAG TPA: N-acetyltransferase [Gemmatimonadetes bacterium]|nr:N-acetyltransferase [Gemmatimonadota bacterium]